MLSKETKRAIKGIFKTAQAERPWLYFDKLEHKADCKRMLIECGWGPVAVKMQGGDCDPPYFHNYILICHAPKTLMHYMRWENNEPTGEYRGWLERIDDLSDYGIAEGEALDDFINGGAA